MKHAKKNRPHDLYVVHYNNQLVATFGIRRSSEKDKGHDHIPGQIHLGKHDAKLFGQCNHDYEFWVNEMRRKGIIPPDPDPA